MPRHFETRLVPYTPQQMFNLVADVASYPSFLPWCYEATIVRQDEKGLTAILSVGYKAFRDTFTSHVQFNPPEEIKVNYGGGPLRSLENAWHFEAAENNGCRISFFVAFEFKSFLLSRMMDLFFDKAFNKMVAAFEQRAIELYGPPHE